MEKTPIVTSDGSLTLYIPEWDEHYHSKFGALEESNHLFINYGLKEVGKKALKVLEIGFGTGLNAFLTCVVARDCGYNIYYETIEKYPLKEHELAMLDYSSLNNGKDAQLFQKMHHSPWEREVLLVEGFQLIKRKLDLLDFKTNLKYDVIYFDAFAPDLQPELWTEHVFSQLFAYMEKGGVLVTYSTKGTVRRALISAGFHVEKIPGPKGGKKENLRARV